MKSQDWARNLKVERGRGGGGSVYVLAGAERVVKQSIYFSAADFIYFLYDLELSRLFPHMFVWFAGRGVRWKSEQTGGPWRAALYFPLAGPDPSSTSSLETCEAARREEIPGVFSERCFYFPVS